MFLCTLPTIRSDLALHLTGLSLCHAIIFRQVRYSANYVLKFSVCTVGTEHWLRALKARGSSTEVRNPRYRHNLQSEVFLMVCCTSVERQVLIEHAKSRYSTACTQNFCRKPLEDSGGRRLPGAFRGLNLGLGRGQAWDFRSCQRS